MTWRFSVESGRQVKGAVATPAVPHPPQTQLSQLHDHITWEHRDRRFLKRRSAACAGSPLVWRAPLFQKAPQTRQDPPKYSRQFASSKYGYPTGDHPYEIRHGILEIPWCLWGHGAPGRACSNHFVSDVLKLLRLLHLRLCTLRF